MHGDNTTASTTGKPSRPISAVSSSIHRSSQRPHGPNPQPLRKEPPRCVSTRPPSVCIRAANPVMSSRAHVSPSALILRRCLLDRPHSSCLYPRRRPLHTNPPAAGPHADARDRQAPLALAPGRPRPSPPPPSGTVYGPLRALRAAPFSMSRARDFPSWPPSGSGSSSSGQNSSGRGKGSGPPHPHRGGSSSSRRPVQLPSMPSAAAPPGSSQNPISISTPSPSPSPPPQKTLPPPAPPSNPNPPTSVSRLHQAAAILQGLMQGKVGTSTTPAYYSMIDEEERDNEVAQQVIDLTQSNDRDELVSLGSFDIRVVGIRFYTGVTTTGEQVLLLREPNNQYDRNAIRVCNVARQQVGHLPRGAAATLSPLIDNRQIQLEGTVTGPKEVYEMPMRVDVYATAPQASHEQIYNTLRRGGIRLENSPFALAMQSQSANKRKAEINAAAAAAAAKRYRGMSTLATSSSGSQPRGIDVMAPFEITGYNYLGGPPLGMGGRAPHYPLPHWPGYVQPQIPQPNLKDLVEDAQRFNPRELGSIIEKFGMGEEVLEKMPLAKQPNRLSITLLPYQLQGLQWLLDHESPKLPTKPNDVVQFWKPTTRGQYINITTKFVLPNPSLASGGILADDMGLGKTVQMISLIIADVEKNGPRAPSCGGTLIVAPLSVMSNWKDQISRHVKSEEPLVISIFHGAGKNAKVDIKSCDVVITSYGTLTSEFENFQTSKKSPIFGLKWRRIILDEAHQIRNPKAKASLASAALEAQSRWALTGTPIVNNLKDLYSLVRYLRFSGGLSEIDIFNRVFMRPLNTGDKEGSERLQALMATICLRRTKEMKFVNLGLPELKEYVHRVKFSKEERDKYDVLKAEAEGLLERYVKGKASRMNQQAAGSTHALQSQASGSTEPANNDYRCLLEYLLRMRQMCNHAMLCGADRVKAIEERLAEIAENGLSEEARSLLQEVLQLAIDSQEDCAICLETLHNPRITVCRHVFGEECIARVIEEQHKCPMCRHDLPDNTSSTLIQPYVELKPWVPQSLEDGTAVPAPSSKIEALIAILKATRTSDPTSKTIVFSQWTKYLDLISPHLNLAGLRFCRIDGSMRVNQRDAAIARLSLPEDDPEAVDVMLASLGVASVGLNLVAANQVILADSWWAPAIEDQAVDRVHRLGQKRETTVWRLVVEDSIEEKVLKIQEAKRELVGRAFKEEEDADAASSSTSGKKKTRRGKGRETRLADLQMLLSRTPAQNHN